MIRFGISGPIAINLRANLIVQDSDCASRIARQASAVGCPCQQPESIVVKVSANSRQVTGLLESASCIRTGQLTLAARQTSNMKSEKRPHKNCYRKYTNSVAFSSTQHTFFRPRDLRAVTARVSSSSWVGGRGCVARRGGWRSVRRPGLPRELVRPDGWLDEPRRHCSSVRVPEEALS